MLITESIIMFKPDAQDITVDVGHMCELHEVGAALLVSAGLEVVQHNTTQLSPDDVRQLYEKALAPNPADEAIWGTAWKDEVVTHISSAPVKSYLLKGVGDLAIPKTKRVKDFLRAHYGRTDNVVQNVAHVPDADEMTVARRLLFGL